MKLQGRTLAIYTEGDVSRGLGHVARCVGYAQHWSDLGGTVRWVVEGDGAARRALGDGADVLWRSWQNDTGAVVPSDVALVDSYSAAPSILSAVCRVTDRPVFIDDLQRLPYPAGHVVHSPPGPSENVSSSAVWLRGPRWHPMRRAFWDAVEFPEVSSHPMRILILTGGVDYRGVSGRLVNATRRALPKVEIDLVLGAGAVRPADRPDGVRIHQAVSAESMRDLMLGADIAVSAAGQTLYELARCGCPAVLIGVADNQSRHMAYWPDTGAGVAAGWWNDPDLEKCIADILGALSKRRRTAMSIAGRALVDGQGVRRLIDRIAR